MKKYHESKIFEDINYSQKEIREKEFVKCQFKKCKFENNIFEDCYFEDCLFEYCNFALSEMRYSRFSDVIFKNSKMIGVNWDNIGLPFRANYNECDLSYSSFYNLKLKNFKFTDCKIHEANFSESDLSNANFTGSDLNGSIFLNTCLNGANFINAFDYNGIDISSTKLKKAIFSLPEAQILLRRFDIILKD